MKLKLLVLAVCVTAAMTGVAYAGDACCPNAKKAAAAAEKAAPAVCKVCPKCGEVAGCDTCCKAAEKCDKCGLHKDSPGCCKLTDEQRKSATPVEMKCDMKGCGEAKAGCGAKAGCPAKAEGGCPKAKAAGKDAAPEKVK